jgi:hypothetical protein
MSVEFDSSCDRVADLQRRLREAWAVAKEDWTDAVAAEFEQAHLAELELHMGTLLNAAREFGDALRNV